MKKYILIFLTFISCSKNEEAPCEEVNNSYIIKLNSNNNTINQEEESLDVLNEWIKEVRCYKCSPETYYEYYDNIVNDH